MSEVSVPALIAEALDYIENGTMPVKRRKALRALAEHKLESVTAPTENKQASRKVEAAPSDTDERETLAGIVQDAGEYVPGSHAADYVNPYLAADKILAAGFSRSQSVQVEVTDEMVERAGRAMYACWDEWAEEDIQAEGIHTLVRSALEAALGGGDQ